MENKTTTFRKIIEKIFAYHRIEPSVALLETWQKDLGKFNLDEIEGAWDRWRKDEINARRVPLSHEIEKYIYILRNSQDEKKTTVDTPYIRGVNFVADEVEARVAQSFRSMPDLLPRLRETKSAKEKILLCASALGKPELNNSPLIKKITKMFNNELNVK